MVTLAPSTVVPPASVINEAVFTVPLKVVVPWLLTDRLVLVPVRLPSSVRLPPAEAMSTLAPVSVTLPVKVLSPPAFASAPVLAPSPEPASWMSSAMVTPPLRASVPPSATVVLPAVLPSASLLAAVRVAPCCTVVLPL